MIASLHGVLHSWIAANAAVIRDHVIFSTVVLLVLLCVSFLPWLSSRTRYALLLLGVADFLIPASALSRLGGSLAVHPVTISSLPLGATFAFGSAPSPRSELPCLFAAMWLAGAIGIAIRALSADRAWRRTLRTAAAASPREETSMREIAHGSGLRGVPRLARCAGGLPMTAGLLNPVVLLPDACAALDDDELKAVLAHEMAHVERRHNLAALIQTAATALFWFDPALWIANHRLHNEAEKDCDERVLELVPDPPIYFSGMLKASYGFIAPRPAGVSCMSTSRLKERMDHLMKHHESGARAVPHRLATGIGIAAVVLTTMFVSAGEPPKSAPGKPANAPAVQKDDIVPPKLVTRVDPVYPEGAKKNGVEGTVILSAAIDQMGTVTDATVAQGIEGDDGKALGEAAVAAVKQWKFEPALENGKPVAISWTLTIRFTLDSTNK